MLTTKVSQGDFNRVMSMEYSCITFPMDKCIHSGDIIEVFCNSKSDFDNVEYCLTRTIEDFYILNTMYQDDTEYLVILRNEGFRSSQLGLSRVQK
jgi:hypothetical protein